MYYEQIIGIIFS